MVGAQRPLKLPLFKFSGPPFRSGVRTAISGKYGPVEFYCAFVRTKKSETFSLTVALTFSV